MGIEVVTPTNPETRGSREKYTLVLPLRELDVYNERDMDAYFQLLTHPDNIEHFSNPPVNGVDLRRKLLRDHTHAYIAENMLGEIVGAGGINDAAESEHDHFLVKVVLHPDYKGKGIGKQLVIALTDIAFSTPATIIRTGRRRIERERIKLDAAIIRDVKDWDKMPRLLRNLGYRFVHFLPDQVTIKEQSTGLNVIKPTERYEITREEWLIRRELREKQNGQ